MIHEDIITYIKTLSSITAIVGDHIYWMQAPPHITKTLITVSKVDGDVIYNLDVDRSLWQISAFSKDKTECAQLAALILQNFKNYAGQMNSRYVVSTFRDCRIFNENTWWHAPTRVQIKYQED